MRFSTLILIAAWAFFGSAKAQCDLSLLQPVSLAGQVLFANEECTDAQGWTHYFNTTTNRILLSIKKNGQDIGSIDLGMSVQAGTLPGFGSGGYNLSGADYIDNEIWIVANRFWKVTGANAIANPVQVRFYFSNTDITDVASTVDDFGFFVDEPKDLYMFTISNGGGLDPFATSTQSSNGVYTLYDMFAGGPPEWSEGSLNSFPYGEFSVNTLDNAGGAGFLIFQNAPPLAISGNIARPNGNPVPDVTVEAASISTDVTDASGDYSCPSLLSGSDYEVVPHKDINHGEGISVVDLIAMYGHVSGLQPLTSPYQIIAANANADTVITFLDITLVRDLLLGNSPNFPNSTSWRFVPANYAFPVPGHPFTPQFPEEIIAANLQDSLFNQDFVGVKIGDVADPSTANPPALNTAFSLPNISTCNPGDTVEFQLTVQDFQNISGFQFTLEWDADVLEYLSASNFNLTSLNANNIGNDAANDGKLSFVWFNQQSLNGITAANGTAICRLRFVANGSVGTGTPISFTSSVTDLKVVHQNLTQVTPGTTPGIFTIENNSNITASAFVQTTSCVGPASGAIDLTATTTVGTVNYAWSNGATTQDIFGLVEGTYSVTMTDGAGGCPLVQFYEVNTPAAMNLSATVTDMPCPFVANGAIEINVLGGEAPFSYQWSDGSTSRFNGDLNEGSYSVTVTDGAGCTSTGTYEVENGNLLMPVVTVTNASNPTKNDGSLTMTGIDGGTGPFTFLWNNGATTMSLTNLLPGDYVVTITDGVGCQHVFGYEVYGLFTATVEAGSDLTDVQAFPNPVRADEVFDLVFTMKNAGKITATLIAADGKIVGRERFQVAAGQSYRQMAAPSANGFYLLHFEVDGLPAGRLKLLVQ
ncbi:MAG: cohesin domain-containing protein [Saprospiraceae bacterium]|jgi:hypothetical protein|nr:cohesin domain-containing protein [Saprospiraceae bacterium]